MRQYMGLERLKVPEYARIERATVSTSDMGAMQIEAEMRIDQGVKPDFSEDWVLGYMGARYIHASRKPEAEKGVDSLEPTVRLQFVHEAVAELRRYWFVDVVTLDSGVVFADKYVVPISLTLVGFVDLLGKVLSHYYGDRIICRLTDAARARASAEPITIEISYTYIWDLLQKIYEYYGERWSIIRRDAEGTYVIEIGGEAPEIGHIFEYGFKGGLMKVRRSPQSTEIKNKIWGRGGEKNLPHRYFKDVDPQNPKFRKDPDWVPELRGAYFDRLRGATFRSYVQGWKTNPRRQLRESDGTAIIPYGDTVAIKVETYDVTRGMGDEPYRRGHEDAVFDPIEYVKDEESISKYGELWGNLEDNDEIFPTIQGMTAAWGPANTAFEVEQVKSDDHTERVESDAKLLDLKMAQGTSPGKVKAQETAVVEIKILGIKVDAGKTGVFERGSYDISVQSEPAHTAVVVTESRKKSELDKIRDVMELADETVKAYRSGRLEEVSPVNMPGGESGASYDVVVSMSIRYNQEEDPALFRDGVYVTVTLNSPKVTTATPAARWGETFNVWLGNIFNSLRMSEEGDEQYAERVWGPILGDKSGGEAAVIFVTGALSVSTDYEFKIVDVKYDPGVRYTPLAGGGTYQSEWRLTLAKSDADLESLGVYVPSMKRQGTAGDKIAFVNVELPHAYTTDAEKRLDLYKEGKLEDVSEKNPSWEVEVDPVRMHKMLDGEAETLVTQLRAGSRITLADERFIKGEEILYLQSVTFEYGKDSMLPQISMVLSNEVMAVTNPVGTIQGEVSEIHRQIGSIGNVERTVRAVGDKLYLRKDGIADRSVSPTQFDALVSSSDFRQGFVGGKGYGFYRDGNGRSVIEADRMVVRESMHVNSFVVNEVTALGGKVVWTAASMRVTAVESVVINDTEAGWRCYFDRKGGTVKNLFHSGDVAYCERFEPDMKIYKMYKSRVYDAGLDYIDLYADGSFYYGDGIPAEGDSIAQFGSYTDAERRYAIVIDVIGGGYVRFLSGLDSVAAQGTEYGFFGRQSTSGERMFIGSENTGFVKYEGGKLTVLGDFTVKLPDGKDAPLTAYIASLINDSDEEMLERMRGMMQSGRNLVLNTNRGALGFNMNSGLSAFSLGSEPMGAYGADAASFTRGGDKDPQYNFENILVDFRPQLISEGYTYNISFDYAIEGPELVKYQLQPSFSRIDGTETLLSFEPQLLIPDGSTHHFASASIGGAAKSGMADSGQKLLLNFILGRGLWSKMRIWNLRVGEGVEQVPWSAAPEDIDLRFGYLTKAFENDTTVVGGLIQSSLVRLGYRDAGGKFVPMAGVNGVVDTTKPGQGLSLWAGGDIIDMTEDPAKGARAAVRMDGTAYFCGNTVRMDESEMGIGNSLTANADGLFMVGADGTPLSVQNKPIGITVESIDQAFTPFGESYDGTINYMWKQDLNSGAKLLYPKWAVRAGTVQCAPGETLTGTLVGTVFGGDITDRQLAENVPLYVVVIKGGVKVYSARMSLLSFEKTKITKKGTIANIQNDTDQPAEYIIFLSGNADAENEYIGNAPTNPDVPDGVVEAYKYVSGDWETTVSGYHDVVTPNQTRLGSDGFGAVWGPSAFFIKKDDMLMRTGQYGLRFSHSGVFHMADGVTWHKIDLSLIEVPE